MVAAKNSSSVSESSAPRSQVVDSTLATWTLALVSRTVEEEADQRSLLLRHGLRLEDLALPDARISHDATCSIWEELTFGHPDPIVGIHFAATLPESTLGIVGYLAMSSETPLDALRRVAEYYRLLKNSGAMGIVEQGERVHVVDRPAPGLSAWPRHLAEGVLFAYKAFIERWTRRPLVPRRVRLQHEAPGVRHLVDEAFGVSVEFGADTNELQFDRADLAHPMMGGDASLQRYLAHAAEALVANLPNDDGAMRAIEEAVLAALPSGHVSIERVARALGVGVRTLQRRLRVRSLTFREVVDRVRRRAAERLRMKPEYTMKDLAFLLGFSDSRSLRKAERRWLRPLSPSRMS